MRLSVSYNFFNGEEHLIRSIESVRNNVDHVSLVYQKISNSGNTISDDALDVISDIRARRLAENIIEFAPEFSVSRQENELAKRNIGLRLALDSKSSHFFTMDADEFYRENELINAKNFIIENNCSSTSVSSYFHIKTPEWRCLDTTCCAFITKINSKTELGGSYHIPMVDPTRSLKTPHQKTLFERLLGRSGQTNQHHHFRPEIIAMYHMNFVRKDAMRSKLANTSTTDLDFLELIRQRYIAWEPGTSFSFPGKGSFEFVKVENEFGTWSPPPGTRNG